MTTYTNSGTPALIAADVSWQRFGTARREVTVRPFQAGLTPASGDVIEVTLEIPAWCRSISLTKRTDFAAPDTLALFCGDAGQVAGRTACPPYFSPSGVCSSSTNTANNTVRGIPVGTFVTASVTVAGTHTQMEWRIVFQDS